MWVKSYGEFFEIINHKYSISEDSTPVFSEMEWIDI